MGLKNFQKEFFAEKPDLRVLICIDQKYGFGEASPINEMLEAVQLQLKKELTGYNSVTLAYVYETPLLDVRPFTAFTQETPLWYKEPCEVQESHNLRWLMQMSLAMIEQDRKEQKQKEQNQKEQRRGLTEYRLYLLTDEHFSLSHIKGLVEEKEGSVKLCSRFAGVTFLPFLYTNQKINQGDGVGREPDLLEKYFLQQGQIVTYTDQLPS